MPLTCPHWLRYLREESRFREDAKELRRSQVVRSGYEENELPSAKRWMEELARDCPWVPAAETHTAKETGGAQTPNACDGGQKEEKEVSHMDNNEKQGCATETGRTDQTLARIRRLLDLRRPDDAVSVRNLFSNLACSMLRDSLEDDLMENERAKIKKGK